MASEKSMSRLTNQLSFDSEAELVKKIELKFLSQWSGPNFSFLRELDSANGVADLVCFKMKSCHEKYLDIGRIPPRWLYALYRMPYRRMFTTSDVAKALGVGTDRARMAMKTYVSIGYCSLGSRKDTWKKIKQPQLLTTKIYAIEAKLRKWNYALTQAIRYQEFANQSWVVLDSIGSNSAMKNIEKFRMFNVGLATIDTAGLVSIRYNPVSRNPKSEYRLWYTNAEIARVLNLSNECDSSS